MNALLFNKTLQFTAGHPEPVPADGEVLSGRPAGRDLCLTDLEITRGYMGFAGVLGYEFVATVVKGPRACA